MSEKDKGEIINKADGHINGGYTLESQMIYGINPIVKMGFGIDPIGVLRAPTGSIP